MVPESAVDRADLGTLLEQRALLAGAAEAYRRAIEVAPSDQVALPYWLSARLRLRLLCASCVPAVAGLRKQPEALGVGDGAT